MEKYRIHGEFKINKMQQENSILKEQVKIVESKIYETGMVRTRTKRSISGQKSSEMSKKLLQRPLPQRKAPQAEPQYPQAQQLIQIESNNSKSKRKLFIRSPTHHPQQYEQVQHSA